MNSVQFARMQNAWKRLIPASERSTVTVMRQIAPLSYQPATATNAWWRDGGTAEAYPTEGATVRASRKWYIPLTEYAYTPAVADYVSASGATWTVQMVGYVGGKGTWELGCDAISLNTALTDTMTLFRPDAVATADGRRVATIGSNVFAGVPAKFQLVDSFSGSSPITAGDRIGRRLNPETIRVYTAYRITESTAQDVLIWDQTGRRFTVQNIGKPAQLGAASDLTTLDVIEV